MSQGMGIGKSKLLIKHRADPQIYKHTDGCYYFTATLPSYDGIILRRATTIDGLREAEEVILWKKHESGVMSWYIWAPEIHYIDGGFCIYFAAKGTDSLDHTIDPHQICILRCIGQDPIVDPWEEAGIMDTGWHSFSLDATTFSYQGQNYFVWAQMVNPSESNSNIYIAKMLDYKTLQLPAVCLTKPEFDWEIIGYKVNEGPAVVQIGDSVYLTYSASATDANYCVGMLTMKVGTDPLLVESWTKSPEPILMTDEEARLFGPGHNSFTYSEDNREVIMVFHARDFKEIVGDPLYDVNRHARIVVFDPRCV